MRKPLILHPFLFAIFPVLFLFAHNVQLFELSTVVRPIVVASCLALLGWSVLSFVLGHKQKAGLIVSLFFVLFFSYESVFTEVRGLLEGLLGAYVFGTRVFVLVAFGILLALGSHFLVRTPRTLHGLTKVANVVAAFLVVVPLINIGAYEVKRNSAWQESASAGSVDANQLDLREPDMLPNIFYIIPDEYARLDLLEELYGFDNTEFVDYLAAKGFYVAQKSRSNYNSTVLSLASSLNLTYLDGLANRVGVESDDLVPAIGMIRNNAVLRFLKHYGYQIVAFSSGYNTTDIRDADVYIAPEEDLRLNDFQWNLMNMTPLAFATVQLGARDVYDLRRERVLYTFDQLVGVCQLEGPFFVFAHVAVPHPPLMFGEHGEDIDPVYRGEVTPSEYAERYSGQLNFINNTMRTTVDGILSASRRPSIIILQGDTGPWPVRESEGADDDAYLRARMSILNAYYLPNGHHMDLYDEITPVNTFRIIFNYCFGTDFELLQDETYWSTGRRPYAFINVTDETNLHSDTYDEE